MSVRGPERHVADYQFRSVGGALYHYGGAAHLVRVTTGCCPP